MKTINVVAKDDHIERIAKIKNPVLAVEELIWNSLDADATEVSVDFVLNELGGVASIVVKDNGTGICYGDAETLFSSIGGSWKRDVTRTAKEKRFLHGKLGQGRFKAYSIGNVVNFNSVYRKNGDLFQFTIICSRLSISKFQITDEYKSIADCSGTTVTVSDIYESKDVLLSDSSTALLEERLMLYLNDHPDVKVCYNGFKLNPAKLVSKTFTVEVSDLEVEPGKYTNLKMLILELNSKRERSLCLCDETGFVVEKRKPGFHAPGFSFSIYVRSKYIRELYESGSLQLDELHAGLKVLLSSVKSHVKDYFRRRSAEEATNLIETWKSQDIYPYVGEAVTEHEIIERQVFDLLALNVNEYLPDFYDASDINKKFSLQLIREALERNPTSLKHILESVLDLPDSKIHELDNLLNVTSLSNIITASKCVADRLSFLNGLQSLIFEHKKHLKERSELHKLVAANTWIFGEEFNLSVSDRSLNEVLKKHIKFLGREELTDESTVEVEGKERAIVDLMLSRKIQCARANQFQHLVIELKRPTQPIDLEVEAQIKRYAFAVACDERFSGTDTDWTFWAISNELSDDVYRSSHQTHYPEGVIHMDKKVTIMAVTWAQIFRNCGSRLAFFQERLGYEPDTELSIKYLREKYEQYLPSSLK